MVHALSCPNNDFVFFFCLSRLVVPLIQGYEDAGDFSVRERLKTSIHVNLIFYLILGLIGLVGLILLIMMQKDWFVPFHVILFSAIKYIFISYIVVIKCIILTVMMGYHHLLRPVGLTIYMTKGNLFLSKEYLNNYFAFTGVEV